MKGLVIKERGRRKGVMMMKRQSRKRKGCCSVAEKDRKKIRTRCYLLLRCTSVIYRLEDTRLSEGDLQKICGG